MNAETIQRFMDTLNDWLKEIENDDVSIPKLVNDMPHVARTAYTLGQKNMLRQIIDWWAEQ